jgi:hypothetical protein
MFARTAVIIAVLQLDDAVNVWGNLSQLGTELDALRIRLHLLVEGDGAVAQSHSRSVVTPMRSHRLIGIHPGRNIRVHPPLQYLTLSGDNGGSHPVFGVNTQIAEGIV